MGTTATFSTMLNQYLPNELFGEELVKRDWLLTNIEKDQSWKGGDVIVPFIGAGASSVAYGALSASNDVAEDQFVRGTLTGPGVEVWGTMIFNHMDLMEHNGKIPETTFLKILPDRVDAFMQYMKEVVSVGLLVGGSFAKSTEEASAASGILGVDHIDRFRIGQKVTLVDGDTAAASYYVTAINVNAGGTASTGQVTLSATRGGAAANVSAYTIAQSAKFYHPGSNTSSFNSIRGVLLSLANGGDTNVHGVAKTAWPILQAVNISGANITATNILDKVFDAYTEVRRRGKGNADKIVLSYKHLGSIMKLIETQKGGYKVTATATRASMYGWTEIDITSVRGGLTIVGVQEMDDDVIFFLDLSQITFRTNGFFQKRKNPDGREYFEVRNTTGYQYLVDLLCQGNLEFRAPGHCGVLYSIPNY
jgi:hypothetical protein